MMRFRDFSIKTKLSILAVASAAIALALCCLGFVSNDVRMIKAAKVEAVPGPGQHAGLQQRGGPELSRRQGSPCLAPFAGIAAGDRPRRAAGRGRQGRRQLRQGPATSRDAAGLPRARAMPSPTRGPWNSGTRSSTTAKQVGSLAAWRQYERPAGATLRLREDFAFRDDPLVERRRVLHQLHAEGHRPADPRSGGNRPADLGRGRLQRPCQLGLRRRTRRPAHGLQSDARSDRGFGGGAADRLTTNWSSGCWPARPSCATRSPSGKRPTPPWNMPATWPRTPTAPRANSWPT